MMMAKVYTRGATIVLARTRARPSIGKMWREAAEAREAKPRPEALACLTGAPPPPAARLQAGPVRALPNAERRWDHLTLEEQLVLNATLTLYQDALWRSPQVLGYL